MQIVYSILIFLLSMIVLSFSISQILIILFFGVPFTNKLEKDGYLKKDNNIKKGYLITVILNFSIFAIYTYFLVFVFTTYASLLFIAFIFFLMGVLSKPNQLGINKDNISDYVGVNRDKFKDKDNLEKLIHFYLLSSMVGRK